MAKSDHLREYTIKCAKKAALILVVIFIQFAILFGGLSFAGYFHLGPLEIPVVVFAVGYAICGGKISYNLIKFSLRKIKFYISSHDSYYPTQTSTRAWDTFKESANGRLAIIGGAIYSVITIIVVFVYISGYYGLQKGSTTYSLLFTIATFACVLILTLTNSKKFSKMQIDSKSRSKIN